MIPFTFGADYYPEHWPKDRWETDAKLMRELGLFEYVPAMCHLDYAMSDAGGVTNFVRKYTLASGGPYCDCGYKRKEK